jgi:hypothetical protein
MVVYVAVNVFQLTNVLIVSGVVNVFQLTIVIFWSCVLRKNSFVNYGGLIVERG